MRTLLAANDGGHLTQLRILADRLSGVTSRTWFVPRTPQSESLLADEEVVWARPAPTRDWRGALVNGGAAAKLVRRGNFDVALSTGSSIAVSVLPVAARLGCRAIYIESATRTAGPSLSGRILRRVPGVATFTQQLTWASSDWPYAGSVFDSFSYVDGPRGEVSRIVVSLGTQSFPFTRLPEALVRLTPSTAKVVWQLGATPPIAGMTGEVHTHMASAELDRAIGSAQAVVCHAGTGIILTSLAHGITPIVVPRLRDHGEHVDEHQSELAREMDSRGLALARSVDELTWQDIVESASRRVIREPADPLGLGI